MGGAPQGFGASTDRPLGLRVRPDLIVDQQRYLGREYWIVKDPLSLKYFRFEEEEYALLSMLDGEISLEQLKRRFESRFAPQQMTFGELHRFLGTLYRSSLVVASARDQGRQLLKRAKENASRRRRAALSSLMSARFRGVDPDRFLDWLNGWVGWVFSIPALIVSAMIMLSASLLITVQFEQFQSKLPAFQDFFAVQNWLWLALTLAITKVLHELGHGLSCKRLGGECHEMGVMLLVFTPCLYCNVSDAWMLPSKWQRASIAAAGMYVELLLAAICAIVWWFTNPGMLNYLCLNVMFISSISTIVFNANPLLRYDGYYILSDLIEIPNLRQKANATIRKKMGAWVAGLPEVEDPFLPSRRRWLFALYAVAASAYRWLVVFSIFWFVYRMLEPYGLKIVGQALAMTAVYSLLVAPLIQLVRFFHVPGRIQKVKPFRVATTLTIVALTLFCVLMIPVPYWIEVPAYVQPRDAAAVYVDVAGHVEKIHVQPGTRLKANDPILTLVNQGIEESIIQLEGELAIEEAKAQNALLVEAYEPEAESQSEQLAKSVETLRQRLRKRRIDQQRLIVRAPRAGVLMPAPFVQGARQDEDRTRLSEWDGNPLAEKNVGGFYKTGTLLGKVGNVQSHEVVLAVDQELIEAICQGLDVRVQLRQLPTTLLATTVEHIATSKMEEVPRGLAGQYGGPLITEVSSGGTIVPQNPTFQVSCPIETRTDYVPDGAIGTAQVCLGKRTIGWRLWRWSMRTFNFEL